MKLLIAILLITSTLVVSCNKEKQFDKNIIGQWKWDAQYRGSPANTLTPQNTGIQETLIFGTNNNWSLIQNGIQIKSGTFKVTFLTGRTSQKVNCLHYSSSTYTDSIAYYSVTDSSLLFSNDLIGIIGDGARVYSKQ